MGGQRVELEVQKFLMQGTRIGGNMNGIRGALC
jgi:hypothetical protein